MEERSFKERLLIVLVALLLSVGALSWSALQLATLITHGHPAQTSFGLAVAIGLRIPFNPGNPFPTGTPHPSPLAYYAAILAVLALPATVAWQLDRARNHSTRSRPQRLGELARCAWARFNSSQAPARGAAWATRRELRALTPPADTAGRLTLGHAAGTTVAITDSLLVVGPSGSMKTSALAIPALLEWDGPVLATSVKTDLLDLTLQHRRQHGDAMVFDPTGLTDHGQSWTPLAGCQDWATARQRASTLCRLAAPHPSSEMNHWYSLAAALLAPLMLAAASTQRTMRDVLRWIDTQETAEVENALKAAGSDLATHSWTGATRHDERIRSSIYTTAKTALDAFADETILDATERSEITAQRLLDGRPNTLYLTAPVDRQTQLRPLFVALLEEIRSAAVATGARTPLHPPLLVLLDEAANIATIPDLDKLASTGIGQGIHLVTIVQDLAQLDARYGREAAATIVNNHRAKLILPGISDPRTLDWVSRVTGETEIDQRSTTARTGIHDSTTQSTTYRPLAPAHLIRQQTPGHGLLIHGHHPPANIKLRPWFKDHSLRRLAG